MDGECKQSINLITNMVKTTTGFDVPKGFPIPLNRSVILMRIKAETVRKSNIILNEDAEENNVAVVMACAGDCYEIIKPGKKVMFNAIENRTILFEDNYYLIMHEASLFCILPDKAVLMPETINKRLKEKEEKLVKAQKRNIADNKKELNNFDRINELAKKRFAKKK